MEASKGFPLHDEQRIALLLDELNSIFRLARKMGIREECLVAMIRALYTQYEGDHGPLQKTS